MVYRLANSANIFARHVSLFISWLLGRHMYFWASIWLQLLKCSGLARTCKLYPVSSWEKTCEQILKKWTAFDSTCTGQDLTELDT